MSIKSRDRTVSFKKRAGRKNCKPKYNWTKKERRRRGWSV